MTQGLRTFLTFQGGAAAAALDLYRDVFDDFELIEIDRYGPGDSGPEDTVKVAKFRLAGSDFSCADSPVRHEWGFTPAVSLWIDCDDNEELERLFQRVCERVERQRVQASELLPVQLEASVRRGHGADARDVPVVELDEGERFAGTASSVVVRLEEGLRAREALPQTSTDQRAELALGLRAEPDDAIPLVEHYEWRFPLYRDGHGADIVRRAAEGVDLGTLRT